jgi:ubiquinone biosynthesis protein
LPLIAHRIITAYDRQLRHPVTANGTNGDRGDDAARIASVRALAGAALAVCGTLVLTLGPGPWLQPQELSLALVGLCYLSGAWLFVSASR